MTMRITVFFSCALIVVLWIAVQTTTIVQLDSRSTTFPAPSPLVPTTSTFSDTQRRPPSRAVFEDDSDDQNNDESEIDNDDNDDYRTLHWKPKRSSTTKSARMLVRDNDDHAMDARIWRPAAAFASPPQSSQRLQADVLAPTTHSHSLAREPPANSSTCAHTMQGALHVVDNSGAICTRDFLSAHGCCTRAIDVLSCGTCLDDLPCCSSYEHCVSCCLRSTLASSSSSQAATTTTPLADSSTFDSCRQTCRTSSRSTRHGNTYRHAFKYCHREVSAARMFHLPDSVLLSMLPRTVVVRALRFQSCSSACAQVSRAFMHHAVDVRERTEGTAADRDTLDSLADSLLMWSLHLSSPSEPVAQLNVTSVRDVYDALAHARVGADESGGADNDDDVDDDQQLPLVYRSVDSSVRSDWSHVCYEPLFAWINECTILKSVFGCAECASSEGPDQPALVDPAAPSTAFPSGKCLTNANHALWVCDGHH